MESRRDDPRLLYPNTQKNKIKLLKNLMKFINSELNNKKYYRELQKCIFCNKTMHIYLYKYIQFKIKLKKNRYVKKYYTNYKYFELEKSYSLDKNIINHYKKYFNYKDIYPLICHNCFKNNKYLYHCCCDLIRDLRINPINYRNWKYEHGKYQYGCNNS